MISSKEKSLIIYILISIYLFSASFFKIYNMSVVKYGLTALIGISCFYFYNRRDLLSYMKIGIISCLLGGYIIQYAFIFTTLLLFNKQLILPFRGIFKFFYLLILFGFISFVTNQFIETNLLAYPAFFMSFMAPIFLFSLFYQSGNEFNKRVIIDFLQTVLILIIIVGVLEFLILGHYSDGFTAGLKSAHDVSFFMSVGFLFVIFKYLNKFRISDLNKKEIILLLGFPFIVLAASAKLILASVIFSIFSILIFRKVKKILQPLLFVLLLGFILIFGETMYSGSYYLDLGTALSPKELFGRWQITPKYLLLEDAFNLIHEDPTVFILGSGPGTFLSRAANSRAYDTMDKRASTGGGTSTMVKSKLPSFIHPLTSWITYKYAVKYFNIDWDGTFYDYRSSLISFFYEFGVIGTLLFLVFMKKIYNRGIEIISTKNKFQGYFVSGFILLFLFNSCFDYYFEYPQLQILFWGLLGLFTQKNKMNISKTKLSYINTKQKNT